MLRNGLKPVQQLHRFGEQVNVTGCAHHFCTDNGGRCAKHTSLNRQSKIMSKLFGERLSGSKKRWYPAVDTTSGGASARQGAHVFRSSQFGKAAGGGGGKGVTRRMAVLNKLFMKHITDLLATGEASEAILGRGLQVTRVKISPDFVAINVYWLGGGQVTADALLERELQRCSGRLRHELSQLMLMSEVPRVYFAREKKYTSGAQVEALLRDIDLQQEEDEGTEQLTADVEKRAEQWRNFAASLTQREFYGMSVQAPKPTQKAGISEAETSWPEMRHDVLGLDHRDMMSRIVAKMRKSKQAWDLHAQQATTTPPVDNTQTMERINQTLATAAENAEKFNKFLAKRRERKNTPERKKHDRSGEWLDEAVAKTVSEAGSEEMLVATPSQRRLHDEEDYLCEEQELGKAK